MAVFGCNVAASGGRLALPIGLVAVTLHPKKDAKGNCMDMLTVLINSIRFMSGLLCSSEHSKVCFQPL